MPGGNGSSRDGTSFLFRVSPVGFKVVQVVKNINRRVEQAQKRKSGAGPQERGPVGELTVEDKRDKNKNILHPLFGADEFKIWFNK